MHEQGELLHWLRASFQQLHEGQAALAQGKAELDWFARELQTREAALAQREAHAAAVLSKARDLARVVAAGVQDLSAPPPHAGHAPAHATSNGFAGAEYGATTAGQAGRSALAQEEPRLHFGGAPAASLAVPESSGLLPVSHGGLGGLQLGEGAPSGDAASPLFGALSSSAGAAAGGLSGVFAPSLSGPTTW